ncbi:MAG: DNA repair protein RecO [Minisyncoccia bacterium]
MQEEYISEGIVLNLESNGDLDLKISLLTEKFGKMIAKVKSAKKITSKLRGHLEPASLVIARIVFKRNFQLVDVLIKKKLNLNFWDLNLLSKILPEMEPEEKLYFKLKNNNFNWFDILKILGWDPKEAKCFNCGKKNPNVFNIDSQEFVCLDCSSHIFKNFKNELIYL